MGTSLVICMIILHGNIRVRILQNYTDKADLMEIMVPAATHDSLPSKIVGTNACCTSTSTSTSGSTSARFTNATGSSLLCVSLISQILYHHYPAVELDF
ncbi:hypothetical protein OIDMADRAFT_21148 [Oidiodendron maius Zn]|uniref:Uncharacterized protein n=1 Tax=Oidiodendron maius (strain Zn) TaxID=913774 RepID=A0A0C3GH60_OIDMZ|nr:hypothetical protein OIDMADRAFT_21148 [Oidiodendron maius Zn]